MNVVYNIYGNDGRGGPIDYSRPIGVTSGLSYDIALPAGGGDFAFGVRAADAESGRGEANTEAVVRVVVDEAGQDVTRLPSAPSQLRLSRRGSGPLVARWYWRAGREDERATSFAVALHRPGEADTLLAQGQVPWLEGKTSYRWQFDGPVEAGPYEIRVRTCNAHGSSRGLATATLVTGAGSPAYQVDNLRQSLGVPRRPSA